MTSLLSDPRVTVFVDNGFKFLADNTATYEATIIYSSVVPVAVLL